MEARTDSDTDKLDAALRRTSGVAALRRLRKLVDAEHAQDAANARAVPRIIVAILVLILIGVVLPVLSRWLA